MLPLPTPPTPSAASPTPSADFTADSYLMHRRSNHCTSCGNIEHWSELYLVSIHVRSGSRRLDPIKSPESFRSTLPIGHTTLPPRQLPCCSRCLTAPTPKAAISPTLSYHPPITLFSSESAWAETMARKSARPQERPERPLPPTTHPTHTTHPTPPKAARAPRSGATLPATDDQL